MKCDRARRLAHEIIWAGPFAEGECSVAAVVEGDRLVPGSSAPAGDADALAELDEHLWSCPECRPHLQQLRALRGELRGLGHRSAPGDLVCRTMGAVRAESRRGRQRRRRTMLQLRRALIAAAAAAAIVAGGLEIASHRPRVLPGGAGATATTSSLAAEGADLRARPFANRDGLPAFPDGQEPRQQPKR